MTNKKYQIQFIIWANIRKFQYLNKKTDEQLAQLLEVSERSLYNYDIAPEKITLGKIKIFMENTGVPVEELIKL